jgi:flagellar hook-basal body complex protein FliE
LPIQGINALHSVSSLNQSPSGTNSATQGVGFGKILSDALNGANQLSNQADNMAASYAAGGPVTVDQLMIAEQKASLAVDLVVQVRNRAVSAYQSIMNMQI